MRDWRGRMRDAGVAALALAAAGLLVFVALGCGESSQPGATAEVESAPVAAAQPASVAALERPQTRRDEIPVGVASQEIMLGAIDLPTARLVRTTPRSIWLARSPDRKLVCVVMAGSLGCSNVRELKSRGFVPSMSFRRGEPFHVSGIAGDAVDAIDVELADGTVRSVEVVGNLLMVDLARAPRSLAWDGPQGREEMSFPDGMEGGDGASRTPVG